MVWLRDGEPGAVEMAGKDVPPDAKLRDDYEALFRFPTYSRVQVPLTNKWDLRKAAVALEELAIRLRQISSNTELSSNRALYHAFVAIKLVNTDLQEATKHSKTGKI